LSLAAANAVHAKIAKFTQTSQQMKHATRNEIKRRKQQEIKINATALMLPAPFMP
jgi:hypothetical protein